MGLVTDSLQFSGGTYASVVITSITTGSTTLDSDPNSLATNQVVKNYIDFGGGDTGGTASISTSLSTSDSSAISRDSSLSTSISNEVSTRTVTDTSLSTSIGTKLPLVGGTISGSLTITGDLLVSGTTTTVRTQDLLVDDNYITLNYGEPGSGVTRQTSGIIVDRGAWSDYMFEFSEGTDTFRIGQSGDTQAVATREDSPTNNGFAIWDSGTTKFVTQTSPTLITSLSTSLSTESSTRISVDTSLSSAISSSNSGGASLTTVVSNEISTRTSADTSLSSAISSSNSGGASLTTVVSNEISTRTSADTSLTTAISNEVSTRTSVDVSLSTAVAGATGNVTKVGTPVDNQVGVWTGNGTIEGSSSLTYTGGILSITGDIDVPLADNWRYLKNTGSSGGLKLGTGNGSGVYTDGISMTSAGNYVYLHHNTTIYGTVTIISTTTCRDYVQVLDTGGSEGFKIQWNDTEKSIDYIIN